MTPEPSARGLILAITGAVILVAVGLGAAWGALHPERVPPPGPSCGRYNWICSVPRAAGDPRQRAGQ